jgi:putative phosphoesterase
MQLGVLSDTHGLLRPQALDALRGSDLIIHAGDIGDPHILEELRKLAPLAAIRGNIDTAPWALSLPATTAVEASGVKIWVLHNLNDLNFDPADGGYRMVISGHSHQASQRIVQGVVYLNPGSAGPRRFRLPTTLARVNLSTVPWNIEILDLLV